MQEERQRIWGRNKECKEEESKAVIEEEILKDGERNEQEIEIVRRMKRRQFARHGEEKEKLNWNDDANDGAQKKSEESDVEKERKERCTKHFSFKVKY